MMFNTKFLMGIMLLLSGITAFSQRGVTVSGKVTDTHSSPVAAVSIHLLNTNITLLSDAQGGFSIQNIAPGTYTLEATAVRYATVHQEIDTRDYQNNELTIRLRDVSRQLDAVTVTAEKNEATLQRVPVSITSISARQIQQYRLWNIKDITGIVPNLNSSSPGDDRNVTSIRGIATTSYDPAVTTYIDGVNQFSLDTYIPQLLDVERIEVLRGPQGTLYGRNAMGGVINIITRQPTNNTNGFVELNTGNYNQQRYSAGIRTPIVKDKLFFGAAALFNKRDGFYTNMYNNSSFDRQQGVSGNYYLKYLLAKKWAFTLNVKHQNTGNHGPFPIVSNAEEAFTHPFELNQNATGKMKDNTFNASLVMNYAGDRFNFSSQTSWQQNHRYYLAPVDGDFSPIDGVTISNDYGNKWNNVKVITEELRFTSPTGSTSPLKWTAGSYFFHQDNPSRVATNFGKDAALLGLPDTDFSLINTTTGKNTGIAVFGQFTVSLSKKLEVIAGLRADHETRKLSVQEEYDKQGAGSFISRPDTAASLRFGAISPKVGLSYHITRDNNVFATYSRGYRTGGLTQLSSDPSQPPLYPYKPEYSNNIEAGIKNTFLNNRLRINVTAFLSTVTDAQVPTLVLPAAITVTRNTGKLSSRGAELELASNPLNGLYIDYSLGYTHARYKSLKVASNGQTADLEGRRQIFTPDVTSMLALQYSYTLNAKHQVKLVARGEWFYLGTQYFDLANNIKQSPYHLLNTRFGVSSKHLDVFFWGRNLKNTKYIGYAYDFGAVHLGDPKVYGATVTAKF